MKSFKFGLYLKGWPTGWPAKIYKNQTEKHKEKILGQVKEIYKRIYV
jgi:hypothetical protein